MTSPPTTLLRPPPRANSTPPWRRALISTTCALALTSCASSTPRVPAPPPIPAPVLALLTPLPQIPDEALRPCPPTLPPLPDDRASTLARGDLAAASQYHACRRQHQGLAEAVRERQARERARIERAAESLRRPDP